MAVDKNGKQLPPGIKLRKDGRYEVRAKVDGKSYSGYANTLADAKKKLIDLKYKLGHGEFVASSKITMDDWFKTWIEQYKEERVKIGTILSYKRYYQYYIKDNLGKKKMTDIRGEHIQKLYNDLRKRDIASTTIKIVSAVLNGCFKQALKNGIIERNPVVLATLPKVDKATRRFFTVEEQKQFFKYAEESYLYNLFSLAIRTGLRSGEIRGLKLSDIDKSEGVLHIKRTLKYETGQGFFEDTPKTITSKRDIPLTKDMIAIIEQEKQRYCEKVVHMDGYIFHLPNGTPISRERLQSEIDRIIKRINEDEIAFERFTPHCFRHSFATRAIENGMKPQTLKTILGHSTLSMTMDLYSHVLPTTRAEEMDLIADAF